MFRRTELALPAAAFVVVLTAILGGGFLPGSRLALGGLLVLVWILAALEIRGGPSQLELAVATPLAWGVMSAVWVGASPLASKEALTAWMVAWLLWCLARRSDVNVRALVLRILAVGGAVVAAAVVVAAVAERSVRVGGLFENPNLAVAVLVPTVPIGLMVFGARDRWRQVSWLSLMGVGIVLTGSRAGMLAAIVMVGVLLPRGRLRTAGVLSGGVIAVAALGWRFVSQPDVLAWHRVSIWWATLKIWATRPLTGVGPGSLVEAAGMERIHHADHIGHYQFVVGYAESTPLAVLVQLGLVGAALALGALGMWFVHAGRTGSLGFLPFRTSLLSMGVLGLFHDYLTIHSVIWWWAILFGCLDGKGDISEPCPAGRSEILPRMARVLPVVWLTAWGIVTPAWARCIWWGSEGTKADVERTLRVEPWYSEPPGARTQILLGDPQAWNWETAAEALFWTEYAARIHPGLARRWADLGRVHLRILSDLGGTEHDVVAARRALIKATEMDPQLPWFWLERARLERMVGDRDRAISLTRLALAQEPNTVRGWLYLCRLELELGRIEAARMALAEAVTRRELEHQSGLSDYELELLAAPEEQLQRLRTELAVGR